MAEIVAIEAGSDRELALRRRLDATPTALWRCWTEPELIKQWFCPPPWRVTQARMDVRPGGESFVVMTGPNGEEAENPGVFLEVDLHRRLVFTDAYVRAWQPSDKPFMTAILTFEPVGPGTLYTARAMHWSVPDRNQHEMMGFHEGWGRATEQLEAVAQGL
jgi:uncharacterized protein YndB with AHSA1/START domain